MTDHAMDHSTMGMARRLRAGQASWADHIVLRGAGLLAYGCFAAFLWVLCELQKSRPQLAGHPAMFGACLLAVVLFHAGSLLTWGGPALFRGEAATHL